MKYFLSLFALWFMPLHGFAEETLQDKIQQALNDETVNDPYQRWHNADAIAVRCVYDLPYEEAMLIYNDILLPFIEKRIKNDSERNEAKAYTYDKIRMIYHNRGAPGDYISSQEFGKKGVEFAELSNNNLARATLYRGYGWSQSTIGSVQLAHEYYYKAIELYESLNRHENVSECLFLIAENLTQIRDIPGLRKLIEQMKQNFEKQSSAVNPQTLFEFYSVQTAYYGLLTEDYPEIDAYKDSILLTARRTIHVIENNMDILIEKTLIGFSYHNMALAYGRVYPDRFDSIYYFLDKALEFKTGQKYEDMEVEISVYISYAELHFEQKRYEEAEKDMLYVLSLLEQMEDYNSVVMEFTEAYKFLVMYYETMNRPREALKYSKLLLKHEGKRYENEKVVAMEDMLVKYETEKKELQIQTLAKESESTRRIMWLAIWLSLVLLITAILIILWNRQKRKNAEQQLYESALLAELKQNELEQTQKRMKQQMEQKPTKAMIGKITEWMSKTYMEKEKQNTYHQKLSELDVDMLEQGYLTADEKISNMDMKYIICFAIDMEVEDMSLLFNVQPTSIHTVRYRIKKKFKGKNTFKFLM